MLLNDNLKMAWASLKSARWRSLLTMLGVIIGVAAVIITVSLSEGLKRQVSHQSGGFTNHLITVRPGQTVKRDNNGHVVGVNLTTAFNSGSLSESDFGAVTSSAGVSDSAPLSLLPASLDVNNHVNPVDIIATTTDWPGLFNQKLDYGSFWSGSDESSNVAVLGKRAAELFFGDSAPIGQAFRLRGQNFLVRGVFEELPPNPLLPTVDMNNAVYIPYGTAKQILNPAPIAYIVAKAADSSQLDATISRINLNLSSAHGGQQDFTILRQSEISAPTTALLHIATQVVVGIALVSLILGGVGIMNIMWLAVTERTREIGIRKAVGATNRQILNQFLAEAAVLSLIGALLGVLTAYVVDFGLQLLTSLKPAITPGVIVLSVGVAVSIGMLFGILPAMQAARKDPIEALRYE